MEINIQELEQYFIYDEPIPYKNLLIKPVLVKDYLKFYTFINCLTIDKNKIPDPKTISMSYLDFIFHVIENDPNKEIWGSMLINLLVLCCDINIDEIKYMRDEKGKVLLYLKDEIIDKSDFDNIKKIICYQNIVDYDETYIDPKLEKALKEAQDLKNKNVKQMCSLEDQIICVLISTSLTIDDIKNISIRKFNKILKRVDHKLHYQIYKSASMSGYVEFKDGIDHWMSDLSVQDKYANVKIDSEEFKKKINGEGN